MKYAIYEGNIDRLEKKLNGLSDLKDSIDEIISSLEDAAQ